MNSTSKIFFSLMAILMVFVILVQGELIEIDNRSKVRPGKNNASGGNVYGARSCGGKGKYIRWRLEKCTTTDSPCEFPTDGKNYNEEFTFIPSQTVNQLAIKIIASVNGSEPLVVEDHPLENSKVIRGIEQTIYFTGRCPKENKGSNVTAQVIFYRVVDQVVEMCAEADFILV